MAARLGLVLALVLPCPARARPAAHGRLHAPRPDASVEGREYHIKAAFLLNFIRYTTWPKESFENADDPIVVTVIGKDPFGSILEDTFRGEAANGRKITVARSPEVPAKVGGHVVFCGELAPSARAELLQKCARQPLLLIGESPGFALDGACINFFIPEQKVRFEINTEALALARLELSPAVLKLAKIVKTRGEGG